MGEGAWVLSSWVILGCSARMEINGRVKRSTSLAVNARRLFVLHKGGEVGA